MFSSKQIGETYLANAQTALGRHMTINLKDLTDSFRDQTKYVQLQLVDFKDQQFSTAITGFHIIPSSVKRMVRKKTSRLDTVFTVTTKDKKEVLIKGIVIALFNSNRSVGTTLRAKMQEVLTQSAAKQGYDQFVNEIITGKMRMYLKRQLKGVHPVREAIVRQFKVVVPKKNAAKAKAAPEEVVVVPTASEDGPVALEKEPEAATE